MSPTDKQADDLQKIHDKLYSTFESGKTRSLEWRKSQLQALSKGINEYTDDILNALLKDVGKQKSDGIAAVGGVLQDCHDTFHALEDWMKPTKVSTPIIPFAPASSWIHPSPLGVSLIVAPWNFPFYLSIVPLIGAISAGCCAVLKPSELAPHSAQVIKKIVEECMDQDAIRVVLGDATVGSSLLSLRWDKIFFTGGKKVGRIVAKAAAENFTSVTLELGGKCPVIVDRDMNIPVCVSRVLWVKMINAGQVCITADHVVIHEDVLDEFVFEFKKLYNSLWGDNPGKPETKDKLPGRIVNEAQWQRLYDMIVETEQNKSNRLGKIVLGGSSTADKESLYIPLTLILNPPLDSSVMGSEIFGPILPITSVPNIDAAINHANKVSKNPLALYVFSNSNKVSQKVLDETLSGGACINDLLLHGTNPNLPFGGVGESGIGSCHGRASFDAFSHMRSVMKRPTWFDPLLGPRNLSLATDNKKQEKLARMPFPFGKELRDPTFFEIWAKRAIIVAFLAVALNYSGLVKVDLV